MELFVGQFFSDKDSARDAVRDYAKNQGFGVVTSRSSIHRIEMVCFLGGSRGSMKDDDETKARRSKKQDCPFKVVAEYSTKVNGFRLNRVILEHNHELPLDSVPRTKRKRKDDELDLSAKAPDSFVGSSPELSDANFVSILNRLSKSYRGLRSDEQRTQVRAVLNNMVNELEQGNAMVPPYPFGISQIQSSMEVLLRSMYFMNPLAYANPNQGLPMVTANDGVEEEGKANEGIEEKDSINT